MVADIRGRFRPIRGRVRHFAAQRDGFGLRETRLARLQDGDDAAAEGDLPDDWPAPPDEAAVASGEAATKAAFAAWLRRVLREDVLEPVPAGDHVRLRRASGRQSIDRLREWDHWTADYVRAAFTEAWETAGGRLRVRGVPIAATSLDDDREILSAFDIGVRAETLRRLYLQAYEGLETIVDDAAEQQIRETITEGYAKGQNPRRVADALTRDIRGLQRRRAETHARTTMHHTRTQSTLDRYEAAGESVVSHIEFSDSSDARVCPFCRRLDGVEMTIDEMRGTHVLWRGDIYRLAPPAHANGRCVPLPSVGADAPTEPLADRVPGTIITESADPHALSQSR
jgi:SPP1 gp7 family putative phage head morphogenesis protein